MFGGVDCSYSQQHNQLCGEYGVKGVPTIRTFAATAAAKRGGHSKAGTYEGPRETIAITQAATALLPQENVHAVTDATHDGFLRKFPGLGHALLFTSKPTTTAMYKALALEYNKRLVFGEVRQTKLSVATVKRYKVTKFPTLLVVPSGGGDPMVHTGGARHIPLSFFFDKFAKDRTEL